MKPKPAGSKHYAWKPERNKKLFKDHRALKKRKDKGEDINIEFELIKKYKITASRIHAINASMREEEKKYG